MLNRISASFAWASALTILLGSFLLFQVQPMISKMILPWFGGSPAVWTTCMLFFQVALLAGYGYADVLVALQHPSRQLRVHLPLLLLAVALLMVTGSGALPNIVPDDSWKPADGRMAIQRILLLLLVHVGLPYLVLAANAPLVQAWFARRFPDRSPYRLYALSNVGSLGALLSYPFLVEPLFATDVQGAVWSGGFCLYALCSAALLMILVRLQGTHEPLQTENPVASDAPFPEETSVPSWGTRLTWLMLPALGSVMLLAVTNHLCQDVAVVPFFWIVPLSLYLLTFIICFDREQWYSGRWWAPLAAVAVLLVSVGMVDKEIEEAFTSLTKMDISLDALTDNIKVQTGVYLVMLFLICMVCHGELVSRKPAAGRLTSFYLMVAAGGAIGGAFVALICPVLGDTVAVGSPFRKILSSYFELNFGLLASLCLALSVACFSWGWLDGWNLRVANIWRQLLKLGCAQFGLGAIAFVTWAQVTDLDTYSLVIKRNFYGKLKVSEHYSDDPGYHGFALYNGNILHGYQLQQGLKRNEPTTYYERTSGIGLAMDLLAPDRPKRVGVVGLGAGTIAALGSQGDEIRFYEINPAVISLSGVEGVYFTFLKESAATCDVVLGDARVQMERELAATDFRPEDRFDIIALDAFSSDAIPAHLITTEAFEVYSQYTKPGGVVAFHISNRYIDLVPVVMGLIENTDWRPLLIEHFDISNGGLHTASSDWVLLSRDTALLDEIQAYIQQRRELGDRSSISYVPDMQGRPTIRWTDRFSNLFEVLHSPDDYNPETAGR